LYTQRKALGLLELAFYWSSTEVSDSFALYQDFRLGNQYYTLKNDPNSPIGVIAIRAF
jgi:hypothetical protein